MTETRKYGITGDYRTKSGGVRFQEHREYDAKNDEEVFLMAKKDGLLSLISLEIILSGWQPCTLLNQMERGK